MWAHKHVEVQCDSATVVDTLRTKTSKCKEIMHLLQRLHFCTAKHDTKLRAPHLPGVENVAADAISHNLLQVLAPEVQHQPDVIPDSWVDLLVIRQPDWTSV